MKERERELTADDLEGVCGGTGANIDAVFYCTLEAAAKSANVDLNSIMDSVKLIDKQKDHLGIACAQACAGYRREIETIMPIYTAPDCLGGC